MTIPTIWAYNELSTTILIFYGIPMAAILNLALLSKMLKGDSLSPDGILIYTYWSTRISHKTSLPSHCKLFQNSTGLYLGNQLDRLLTGWPTFNIYDGAYKYIVY